MIAKLFNNRVCFMSFNMITRQSLAALVLFMFAPDAFANLDRASEAGFQPHKALYDIKLSSKKSGAKVSNITGKMLYEWQPSCDAWISNHRFDMVYEYAELPSVRIKSDYSTYESFDGKTLNFSSQRKRGDVLLEELRGSASSQSADFTIPDGLNFEFSDNTLFPMAHTLSVLDKIKSGQKFYNATIFDGSDTDGAFDINSFIGEKTTYTPPEKYAQNIDTNLTEKQGWKIRLAFFPLNDNETISDYEMSIIFHENGVISDMTIEYSDFSVSQKLMAVEKLGNICEKEE